MMRERLRITIYGIVQGVGFRPFVYRLATDLGLKGWVVNSCEGVVIEAEGRRGSLDSFLARLKQEGPPQSHIYSLQYVFLDPAGFPDFEIRESDAAGLPGRQAGAKTALILPDIATCPECLEEIFDPSDRRYLYPFTNCTHCGPRYSIIEAIPYDRKNTSMKKFSMCPACRKEYNDPFNRRFHAQPNACPVCGPHLELWDAEGNIFEKNHQALLAAVAAIQQGRIVAVKGIGGFHLWVDASREEGVRLLRRRKRREEKPFALMFPTLEMVKEYCLISPQEEFLLTSREAPIVLLAGKGLPQGEGCAASGLAGPVCFSVAQSNPYLGVMLPYSPLHHILMREMSACTSIRQRPVVATSGNLSDEPICIDEKEALARLSGIADMFLIHNRPIVRPVDDSVVRVMMHRPLVLRRARGYAPLPVSLNEALSGKQDALCVLAVGGHLKNTVALSVRNNVFISQHIGDLQTAQSLEAFSRTIESLRGLYEPSVDCLACDLHPEYLSTKFARGFNLPAGGAGLGRDSRGQAGPSVRAVQHHYAHIVSCMAENHLKGKVLGIAWDGTGFGEDRTIWGGEFLVADLKEFSRVGHFRTFPLPGGEKAVQEPRRTAFGLLSEIFGDAIIDSGGSLPDLLLFSPAEINVLRQMISKGVNSPRTSSVGRLFDAVASLCGVMQRVRFEGQAAMALEYLLREADVEKSYPCRIISDGQKCLVADWEPMIREIINDVRASTARETISAKFHNTLVETAVDMAKRIQEERVVLSGGCFQNKYLTERLIKRLRQEGFQVFWHQWVPPNDGGISLGQAVAAIHYSPVPVRLRRRGYMK
jgi:hydrogenase maturation protein HypF